MINLLRKTLLAAFGLVVAVVALDWLFPLPDPQTWRFARVVVAEDGTPLTAYADARGIWRYPTTPEQVAPAYLDALLNYEDRYFWRHPGINPVALLRAAWQNLSHGDVVSGGSTLTMQVARILDPHPRTLAGKLRQMFRAGQLEAHYTKPQILTFYLNLAPFGGTIEGVQAASYTYFGKPAKQLSDAEAALLAVLPQAPTRYRPDLHPAIAQQARDKLLQRMVDLQVWSNERIDSAKLEVVTAQRFVNPSIAPLLSRRLIQAQPDQALIQTTLNVSLQQALEQMVRGYMSRLPEKTSAAVLVVDNRTLAVKAYVGSADFLSEQRFGQIDMIQAERSPGSTLKPFLYGMALDQGLIHSESLMTDAPSAFGDYRPRNFSESFTGPVSASDALRRSLNVPAVQLLDQIGPSPFVARLKNAGAMLELPSGAEPNLSVILGGLGSNLESLTGLYTALGSGGQAGHLRFTQAELANTGPESARRYLLSPGAAWIVRVMLEDNARPDHASVPRWLQKRATLAWKTGTSYGFRDSWALGVAGNYSMGVWVGRPDGSPLPGTNGGATAAPLLFSVSERVNASEHDPSLLPTQPASVTETTICWPLGREEADTPIGLCHEHRKAWVLDHTVPPTLPDPADHEWGGLLVKFQINPVSGKRIDDACSTGSGTEREVALWPRALEPWLNADRKRSAQIPPFHPSCARPPSLASGTVKIEGVNNGAILRAPIGAAGFPSVTLKASGAQGKSYWFINGAPRYTSNGETPVIHTFANAGGFQIAVVDEQGRTDMVRGEIEGD